MNSHTYVIFINFATNVFFVNIYVIMKKNNVYNEFYPFILKIWQVVLCNICDPWICDRVFKGEFI